MTILLLFFTAFTMQFLITSNVRNISQGRLPWAMATSFLIAITQGTAVIIIASQLGNWLNLFFYGCGASAGVSCGILLDRYLHKSKPVCHRQKKKEEEKE